MAAEIQPHDIGTMLYNISTATLSLTKAKKRWRCAYFTIHFSNIIQIIPRLVAPEVCINIKEASNHRFYGIDKTQLVNILRNKDLETLRRLDGVKGLAKALHTHLEKGINGQDLNDRTTVFGSNTYHKLPPKGLLCFVVEAFKDVTILILIGCAVLSLGFGIKEDGIKEGWYESGSILLAVFLVIFVSAVSNFRQETQFDILSKISNNIKIDVVRDGRRQKISIFDIVVGEIVVLNVGDQIPADGLFIDGHSLLVDESSMTGESDQIDVNAISNPFLISGAKVADGHCRMLVLSVGMNTTWGKMMSSSTGDKTPSQSRLNKLACSIGKIGLALTFLVLLVVLTVDSGTGNFSKAQTNLKVTITESLPITVTLTLAYSMKRMIGDEAIATECGILESNQEEEEEEEVVERMQKVNKICVARSSAFNKLLMVKCLKQNGHAVAVTRDRTNDAPELEEVNIGLSMEIQETEEANQISANVISDDDNIASISTVLMCGRCVYNKIQRFIQFQLTVNVGALVINFIPEITSSGVPLTAVQLLQVNLIMDTLGALALATTQGATKELLTEPPAHRVKPHVINIMWRNIFAPAICQITVLLAFQFKGEAILNVDEKAKNNIIFITFVLCQVFNEFNSRKLKKRNIFNGIHKNMLFDGIIGIAIVLETLVVKVLKKSVETRRPNSVQWGICIAIAALSWSSQKEDAWNSENNFHDTTLDQSMKKIESELARLRAGACPCLGADYRRRKGCSC